MRSVGIRELKERASEISRRVREEGEEYQVTYHGCVIARVIRATPAEPASAHVRAVWADLDRLAEEIGRRWPAGVSTTEAVKAERRER